MVHRESGWPAVKSSSGLELAPTAALDKVGAADIVFVCGGVNVREAVSPALGTALRRLAERRVPLGSLCTGGYALAKSVTAISLWNIDPEEAGTDYQATLIVTTPGEEPVPFEMNLSKGRMRYRAIQTVLSIPISTAGFLTFEVLLNRKHVATHKVVLHDPETYNPFGSHLRPGADR